MPFEDSIRILGLTFVCIACAAVVIFAIYRLIRYKRLSRPLMLIALLAMLPLSFLIIAEVIEGDIEYNPLIRTREELVGTYSNGDRSLTLKADGTFTATGLLPLTSGTWSNYDWNLTLNNADLAEHRIITRNGVLCIAPFYAEVDAPIGLLLKKESQPHAR